MSETTVRASLGFGVLAPLAVVAALSGASCGSGTSVAESTDAATDTSVGSPDSAQTNKDGAVKDTGSQKDTGQKDGTSPKDTGGQADTGGQTDTGGQVDVVTHPDTGASCEAGSAMCGGACVDTATSATNCGACGTTCPTGQSCVASACACPTTTPNTCGTGASEMCTDLMTDGMNCGTCGKACTTGFTCTAGACVCSGTTTLCGTACTDTTKDNANCGACGTACTVDTVCAASKCVSDCPMATPTYCGTGATAFCANTITDVDNCGACGTVCPGGQTCTNSACGCAAATPNACGTGATAICTNTMTDSSNCGTCGTVCLAGQTCVGGVCDIPCPLATPTVCGTGAGEYCANTTTDPSNCGGCGDVCALGASCAMSACACPAGQSVCGAAPAVPGDCVPSGQCLLGALPTDCAQLHLLAPALASGVYTIDPDGAAGPIVPYVVYCDMAADGGGWTLTMKADGTANDVNAARFDYNASTWTTKTVTDPNYLFNTAAPDITTRLSAKYASFNTLPLTQVRLGMASAAGVAAITYVQFSLPGAVAYTAGAAGKVTTSSLQALFASNTPIAAGQPGIPAENAIGAAGYAAQNGPPAGSGSPTRSEWLALTQPSFLQPNCNYGGINVDTTAGNASWGRTRVGFLGNENSDCTSPDSYMGLGNNGASCGEPSYTVGNSAGCVPSGNNGATAAFAYLYVRNTDFRTVVPAKASCAAHLAAGYTISGIYPLTYGAVSNAVYCDMTHAGGGWTMAYKFGSGLPKTDDANALWTGAATNESIPQQLNTMSALGAHGSVPEPHRLDRLQRGRRLRRREDARRRLPG